MEQERIPEGAQPKITGLVAPGAVPTAGKGRKDNYEYLHTPERKAEEAKALAEARAKVAAGDIHYVQCLICAHEHPDEPYVARTIITHLYAVHGIKKEQYQALCMDRKWIDSPDEAPVRSPDYQQVFKAAGKTGATKLFEKIDRKETHLFIGDRAEDSAGQQTATRQEAERAQEHMAEQGVPIPSTPEEEAEAEETDLQDLQI